MPREIAQEYAEIAAVCNHLVQGAHRVRRAACQKRLRRPFERLARNGAERVVDVLLADGIARKRQALIRKRKRVAHAAVRRAGDQPQTVRIDACARFFQHRGEVCDDMRDRQTVKIEPLTAGNDRRRKLLRLGRRQNEQHVRGRLLKRFQQRVERRGRQHVDLVDDEYAIFKLQRRELRLLDQRTHVVDAVVGRRVDLDHVRAAREREPARRTLHARFAVLRRETVDRARQNLCRARLARSARTAEQVGVGNLALPHLILENRGDMVLSDDLFEGLRTVFAIQSAPCQSVRSFPDARLCGAQSYSMQYNTFVSVSQCPFLAATVDRAPKKE